MFASLSRRGSRIGNPYICSSCLSGLLVPTTPRLAAPFSSTDHNGESDKKKPTKRPHPSSKSKTKKIDSKAQGLKEDNAVTGAKKGGSGVGEGADKGSGGDGVESKVTKTPKATDASKPTVTKTPKATDTTKPPVSKKKKKKKPTPPETKQEETPPTAEGTADPTTVANSKEDTSTPLALEQAEKPDTGDGDSPLVRIVKSTAPKVAKSKAPATKVKKKGGLKSARTEKRNANAAKIAGDGKTLKVVDGIIRRSVPFAENAAFAAQIQEFRTNYGETVIKKALFTALQGRGDVLSGNDQVEVLSKLREEFEALNSHKRNIAILELKKSMKSKLPPGKPPASVKGARTIKEAMQMSQEGFKLRRLVDEPAAEEVNKVRMVKSGGAEIPDTPARAKVLDALEAVRLKKTLSEHEIETISATELELVPVNQDELEVPSLSYGLERVLFNPGVYQLQDPRSRVFNFDPYLETIMPVNEFDFKLLKKFITSSKDSTLIATAAAEKKKYTGSTSSMTSTLAHFHYLLSQWRPINPGILSKNFPTPFQSFTALHRAPTAIFLRHKDGVYAIDADKQFDTANILSMLGQSMEKLLTLSTEEFEQYRKHSLNPPSEEVRSQGEAYHYTTMGDFLMRSQLDAHDPRIPGTGMFDLKTRAVVSIRMDTAEFEHGRGYEIRNLRGEWQSYEREYYDMIRSAFLKYSLQVRMGRMDGIFVAFHNTQRIFGFQYISLPEMDYALHGSDDVTTGNAEFKLSLSLMNRVLDRATKRFPEKSLRIFFETRPTVTEDATPYMYIFAQPIEEEEVEKIQSSNKDKVEAFEKDVLGLHSEETEKERAAEWERLQATVEARIENDGDGIGETDTEIMLEDKESEGDATDSAVADLESDVDELDETNVVVDGETQVDALEATESNNAVRDDVVEESFEVETVEPDESMAAEESVDIETQEEQASTADANGKEEEVFEEDATEEPEEPVSAETLEPELVENEDLVSEQQAEETAAKDAAEIDMMAASGPTNNEPILAMYLTIRNKVNGKTVPRPDDLSPSDDWKVEYALAEIPDRVKAHALLEASMRRRQKALTKRDEDEGQNSWNSQYLENIRKLSDEGRSYRKEVDEREKETPKRVLDGVEFGGK